MSDEPKNDDRIATFNVDELARWICSEFDVGFGGEYRAIRDVANALRDGAPKWSDEGDEQVGQGDEQGDEQGQLRALLAQAETAAKHERQWIIDSMRERCDENADRARAIEARLGRIESRLEARKATIAQILSRLQELEKRRGPA